ncbi:MAG: aminotransferase class I/II-fold pyridoxal phosphate-dependent enzyme [Oscillospiraceae bacterium]|jgi:arginine decarboxylase|nr:aminotransferase class I/II-fold pyridoxal phosphate-dependent enzyme [Oscillospiraceae bacterium]
MLSQADMPIFTALKEFVDTDPVSFYMPGHKHGRGFSRDFIHYIPKIDITDMPDIDDLHYPNGFIKDAQELAASLFGADKTYFLINGSSCGIMAAILSLCKRNEKIIIGRNCHKSVVSALTLGGAVPVYISHEYSREYGIITHISPESVEKAITKNPDCKCVFITSPGYYGICSDIQAIADICQKYNKPLVVDEAHGSHLKFHPELPESAMESGADICIQSAHKTLAALTQTAYLHVKSNLIDFYPLEQYLSMFQTTSPSYVLMASLDFARKELAEKGKQLLTLLLKNIRQFKVKMQALPRLSIINKNTDIFDIDMTRIVINCRKLGVSGFDLGYKLRSRFNIRSEMCDLHNIVLITTMYNTKDDFDALFNALTVLYNENKHLEESALFTDINSEAIPMRKYIPAEAFSMASERISLRQACGRISAVSIVLYPPGIPVLCPGEIISEAIIRYIEMVLESNGTINNIDNKCTIEVVV